jgi:hypothetical protein
MIARFKTTAIAARLIQSIGRARRPHSGKSRAFVMDIIDTHPFGLAAYKKRFEIYQQQGFEVLNSSMSTVSFYGENKEVYPMQKAI